MALSAPKCHVGLRQAGLTQDVRQCAIMCPVFSLHLKLDADMHVTSRSAK